MNRIFSHKGTLKTTLTAKQKGNKSSFGAKAETDDDENDHTRNRNFTLLKRRKKDETLKECAFGTPQKEEEEEE